MSILFAPVPKMLISHEKRIFIKNCIELHTVDWGDLGHRGYLGEQLPSVFEPQLLCLRDKKRQ